MRGVQGLRWGETLLLNPHWRAHGDCAVECLRHIAGQADAAVRSRVAGEVAFVHADAADDAHPQGHGRSRVMRAGRAAVFARIHIALHDSALCREIRAEKNSRSEKVLSAASRASVRLVPKIILAAKLCGSIITMTLGRQK